MDIGLRRVRAGHAIIAKPDDLGRDNQV